MRRTCLYKKFITRLDYLQLSVYCWTSIRWQIASAGCVTSSWLPPSLIMPRKKPLVPKRRNYSRDLKRRVIYQAEVLDQTSTEISINLDIPLRVIQRVKQTWNEIGEVCKDRTAIGRAPLMHPEHCEVSNHFAYMYGLCLNSYLRVSLCSLYWSILQTFIWMNCRKNSKCNTT